MRFLSGRVLIFLAFIAMASACTGRSVAPPAVRDYRGSNPSLNYTAVSLPAKR